MLVNQQISLQIQVFFLLKAYYEGKKRRKFKGKWYELVKAETFNAEMNIRNAAKGLNDQELLRKIGTYDFGLGPDFPAMKAQYHHQCKKVFQQI